MKAREPQMKLKSIGTNSDLKDFARTWFELYSLRETGSVSSWDHLGKKRQLEWMQEVLLVANLFMEGLVDHVKPLVRSKSKASYSKGYENGVAAERTFFIKMVKEIYDNLNDDYDEFKVD